MASMERDLTHLLAGDVVPVSHADITFTTQPLEGQDSGPLSGDEFRPVIRESISYVVMAVVFDSAGRVLMIQEAKDKVHGLWYLPAGRVEAGENFIDAVKREVMEEAGLVFEPITLLRVAMRYHRWFTFTFLGKTTGGSLKTLDQQDEESLQAQWYDVEEVLNEQIPIRHINCLATLRAAVDLKTSCSNIPLPQYQPGIHPYHQVIHRLLIVSHTDRSLKILCNTKNGSALPCCYMTAMAPVSHLLQLVFKKVFNYEASVEETQQAEVKGLLSVEHCGIPTREHDGICMTSVIALTNQLQVQLGQVTNPDYTWEVCSEEIRGKLTEYLGISGKGQLVQQIVELPPKQP